MYLSNDHSMVIVTFLWAQLNPVMLTIFKNLVFLLYFILQYDSASLSNNARMKWSCYLLWDATDAEYGWREHPYPHLSHKLRLKNWSVAGVCDCCGGATMA